MHFVLTLFIVISISGVTGDNETTSQLRQISTLSVPTSENDTTSQILESSTNQNSTTSQIIGGPGWFGGWYHDGKDPSHYIHGTLQLPRRNYYGYQIWGTTALEYYLAYGLSKMNDENFEYEEILQYNNTRNRTLLNDEILGTDLIVACHPNATFLCLENMETVCLLNGTIYCMSKISSVRNCTNNTQLCVDSVVPCAQECASMPNNFVPVSLSCIGTIIVHDVTEFRGTSISRVGGTFVLVPALSEEDRTFCVTIIVEPMKKPL